MRIIAIRHDLVNKVTRALSNCNIPQKCEIEFIHKMLGKSTQHKSPQPLVRSSSTGCKYRQPLYSGP